MATDSSCEPTAGPQSPPTVYWTRASGAVMQDVLFCTHGNSMSNRACIPVLGPSAPPIIVWDCTVAIVDKSIAQQSSNCSRDLPGPVTALHLHVVNLASTRDTRNSPRAAKEKYPSSQPPIETRYKKPARPAMATCKSQATTLDRPRAVNKPPRAKAKGETKGFHASRRSWYRPRTQDQRQGAVGACVAHTKRPRLASSLVAEIKPGLRSGPTRETRIARCTRPTREGQENQEMRALLVPTSYAARAGLAYGKSAREERVSG
ncbi:hypothetical protein BP5796_07120 [Coleophoma crateriformis]|uniref:Uncharacterized protein n=1 Tax=Coleophoma crateriformis TaxID=565419 RepID=A0A3D8RIC4_9HELO|nr:hypothetical protein BP5796_07120 [Coleophoma crateriformis]